MKKKRQASENIYNNINILIIIITCVVCKVLTGPGLIRRTFKTKLIQLNSDTPYSYMYYHSNF